jgi:ketosteroid isomerase-like protein
MDRFADIAGLLSAYATGYDTGDWASICECFTPDGVFELIVNDGADITVYTGRDELGAFMRSQLEAQQDIRRHFSTNLRVVTSDEESAQVASYLLLGVAERAGLRIVQSGQYLDTIVWQDGAARFAHRRLTMDGIF